MTKNLLAVAAVVLSLAVPGAVTFAKDAAPAAIPAVDAVPAAATVKKKGKRAKHKAAMEQAAPAK